MMTDHVLIHVDVIKVLGFDKTLTKEDIVEINLQMSQELVRRILYLNLPRTLPEHIYREFITMFSSQTDLSMMQNWLKDRNLQDEFENAVLSELIEIRKDFILNYIAEIENENKNLQGSREKIEKLLENTALPPLTLIKEISQLSTQYA